MLIIGVSKIETRGENTQKYNRKFSRPEGRTPPAGKGTQLVQPSG